MRMERKKFISSVLFLDFFLMALLFLCMHAKGKEQGDWKNWYEQVHEEKQVLQLNIREKPVRGNEKRILNKL